MKVGIIGAGTMGSGIAHVVALNKFSVKLMDINENLLDSSINYIEKSLKRQLKKDSITKSDISNTLNNIQITTKLDDLCNMDIVIEAATEDQKIKGAIFSKLDKICHSKTIFASNTSSISISKIALSTNRSNKVIGMHFMNPVPIMRLIEVIKGKDTNPEIIDRVVEFSKSLNKVPVLCNDSPGFISNRILIPMLNESIYCFMEGVATAEAIDQIMKLGMNHPIGPLKLADLIGLDVVLSICEILEKDLNNSKYMPCPLLKKMVQDHKLGIKTGQGFYKYK